MRLDHQNGVVLPVILDRVNTTGSGLEFAVCPGKGVCQSKLANEVFPDSKNYVNELGRFVAIRAARAVDEEILRNASSGGIMTQIALYLLESNVVDGVTAARFQYGAPGPRAVSFIASNRKQLQASQGSKYCPTTTNVLVRECVERGGRYLFNGLPCQVAALRLATKENPNLKNVFPLTLTNFCGGYRDYRSLDGLLSRRGITPSATVSFRYRGGGQPGSMYARDKDGKEISEPYPEYMRGCDIPKAKRCVYCIDATGELSDFSCGDAWLERFTRDASSWSILVTRSPTAERIVSENGRKRHAHRAGYFRRRNH